MDFYLISTAVIKYFPKYVVLRKRCTMSKMRVCLYFHPKTKYPVKEVKLLRAEVSKKVGGRKVTAMNKLIGGF